MSTGLAVVEEGLKFGFDRIAVLFGNHHALLQKPQFGEFHLLFEEALVALHLVPVHEDGQALLASADGIGSARRGWRRLRTRSDRSRVGLHGFAEPHAGWHGSFSVAYRKMQRAFGAHDALAKLRAGGVQIRKVGVGGDRTVDQLLAFRILINQLNVVRNIPTVFVIVQAADTHDIFRGSAEHPVCDIDLMGGELGGKSTGELLVETPIQDILFAAGFHGPTGVAVPLGVDVGDVAEESLVDHLLGCLVELAIAALQADLHDLFGMSGD